MKRLSLLLSLLLVLLLGADLFAQSSFTLLPKNRADGTVYTVSSLTVDSAGTYTSQTLDLTEYDDESFATYPVAYYYDITKVNATDTVNVSIQYWVSYDNSTFVVADTIATVAVATSTSNPAPVKGTIDLNNVKAPYSQFRVINNTGSKKHYISIAFYFYRK